MLRDWKSRLNNIATVTVCFNNYSNIAKRIRYYFYYIAGSTVITFTKVTKSRSAVKCLSFSSLGACR